MISLQRKSEVASKTEKMSQKNDCSSLLTKEGEITITTLPPDSNGHSRGENDSIADRTTGIVARSKQSNSAMSDEIRRRKSEGRIQERSTHGLLKRRGGSERSALLNRQATEDLREVADFPVKPYYNDDSDHTVSVP